MRSAYVILALLLLSTPIFAATLNVNATSLAPSYVNTNSSVSMLNLTLNVSGGIINLTVINITFTVATANLSSVELLNASNAIIASSSTFNATDNKTTLSITGAGIQLNASSNQSFVVRVLLSSSATRFASIAVNVTNASSEFRTNNSADNYTIQGGSVQSGSSQIQDVQANASISPRFVDTNVTNQTLIYVITPLGNDRINSTVITLPGGYTFIRVAAVTIDGSNTSGSYTLVGNITGSTQLRINYTGGTQTSQPIIVYFVVNTSATSVNSIVFNSTVSGSNITNATTTITGFNTNVTTQQLINVTRVTTIKNAAYLNGTDYWEFNFTFNFTANTSGSIQFMMNNWTNFEGTANISLTNGTDFYASLRDSGNTSKTINITNTYNQGLNITSCCTTGAVYSIVLRMVIPSTVTTISSGWWTTYSMLLRAEPS